MMMEQSIFLGTPGLEYFMFEEDFMEANMRCIPMAIRFKLDKVRIKLKLAAWAKFSSEEKMTLALKACETASEQVIYARFLTHLIERYSGQKAAELPQAKVLDAWEMGMEVPDRIREKALEFGWEVSLADWNALSDLKRYSLLKLTNPSHENKNFPIAMHEFGLV